MRVAWQVAGWLKTQELRKLGNISKGCKFKEW